MMLYVVVLSVQCDSDATDLGFSPTLIFFATATASREGGFGGWSISPAGWADSHLVLGNMGGEIGGISNFSKKPPPKRLHDKAPEAQIVFNQATHKGARPLSVALKM